MPDKAVGLFNNADVNRCPQKTLALYDMAGQAISAATKDLIRIGKNGAEKGKIVVDPEQFAKG